MTDTKNKTSRQIPQSAFSRAGRLLAASAKIASREIKERVTAKLQELPDNSRLATKIKQTQDLVQTLSQLKGAAMKAGQLISLEFSDLMPPEVNAILRSLHDSSTTMPLADVEKILLKELGPERRVQLKDLSPEPIASASIGQVHRATLNGKDVAIKIQFPGVAKSIDSDLAILKRVASLIMQMQGKAIDLGPVFEELGASLKRETDYTKEAASLIRYRAALSASDLQADAASYVVPEVYGEFSTKRVLTLSYEEGQRISKWLEKIPSDAAVEEFAHIVLRLLFTEFFAMGLVQTDPNYGNFLYRPGKKSQLVLLDFGATNSYSKAYREDVRRILRYAASGEQDKLLAAAQSFGLLDPRESDEARALFIDMMQLIIRMFLPEAQPFQFADADYISEIRTRSMRFAQKVQYSTPARQVLFLNRKLGGMYHLLKDMDAKVDLTVYFEQVMEMDI